MDVINALSNIYKKELAEANERKVIALAQCEIYKNKIKELEDRIAELEQQLVKKES